MKPFSPLSVATQIANHLRLEILERRLHGEMPGIHAIADELQVNHKTVKVALGLLEKEGLIASQGSGKPRRILAEGIKSKQTLRIAILLYEPNDRKIDFLLELLSRLREKGHAAFFASKTLIELKMDVKKVGSLVASTEADAWVVAAGSKPILEWFASQPSPVFGLFGRSVDVPIAAANPEKVPALLETIRRMVSLGHRRIVLLTREERRKPHPGFIERAILDELEAQGIPTGPFNLPDWEETPEGFRRMLDALFRHTPPTALLIQGTALAVATLQHFAQHGILIPRDVSLVCMDPDPAFAWCDPAISHLTFDSEPWLRHIIKWADHVANGNEEPIRGKRLITSARLVEGGTIGPAKN